MKTIIRDVVLKYVCTPNEAERYRLAAKHGGMQLSPWMRHLAEKRIIEQGADDNG